MLAASEVYGQCTECGIDVPITVEFTITERTAEGLVIGVEPDLTDVMAHSWTHE